MLSEHHYWMFGNALLLFLDAEALCILGLHLWFRRYEFSFVKHGVSLAFFIYVTGHMVFRVVAWELWRQMGTLDIRIVAANFLRLWNTPLLKTASLLDIIGLIMITAVLTWNIRYLWVYATSVAIILAMASTLLT